MFTAYCNCLFIKHFKINCLTLNFFSCNFDVQIATCGKICQPVVTEAKFDFKDLNIRSEGSELPKDPSPNSSPQGQGCCIREKGSMLLKKKAPSLRFKGLNPEFFRRLEERAKDELSVEVVLPCKKSVECSQSQDEEEPEMEDGDSNDPVKNDGFVDLKLNHTHGHINDNSQRTEKRIGSYNKLHNAKCRGSEGNVDEVSFVSNGANWSTIQRQLSQLERQQSNLMNMLQVCLKLELIISSFSHC